VLEQRKDLSNAISGQQENHPSTKTCVNHTIICVFYEKYLTQPAKLYPTLRKLFKGHDMGYGTGVVDWGMQTAPMPVSPKVGQRAYAKAYDKAAEEVYLAAIKKNGDGLLMWRKQAIEVQKDCDAWIVSAESWKETAMYLGKTYAPDLSTEDITEKYRSFKPGQQQKYYQEYVGPRKWDK